MKKRVEETLKTFPYYIKHYGIFSSFLLTLRFLLQNITSIKLKEFPHPIFLRKNSSDDLIFHSVFGFREYEVKYVNIQPKVIIDCGANIGLFSVYMKGKYPEATIYAYEPDAENFEMLQKNTSSYNNIFPYNLGIWNKSTFLRVYDKFDGGKWAMVVEETDDTNGIKSVSLGDIIKQHNLTQIDILKIDIETSEKIVFSDNYETWLPKVKVIMIELHDWLEKGTAQPFFNAINKTFEKYSFYLRGENVIIVNESL